jgi:predicted DsbA family dithiol-disulfide isomerase
MPKVGVVVYSDYVCPYSYLAERPLKLAAADRDVEIEWRPCELRPYPVETLRPESDDLRRIWRDSVYPLARRLDVPIALPSVSPQPYTRLAFEGYQYAREHGAALAYNERMLRAFFVEELDIGDLDTLCALSGEVGLDQHEYRWALVEGRYSEAHDKALARARADQVTHVPTFLIGGHRIEGMPTVDVLSDAIEREFQRLDSEPDADATAPAGGASGC